MSTVAATGAETTAAKKRRVFLSYGHDEYEELAARLVKDLEDTHAYEVWFDKRDILPGSPWAREIEKGLRWASEGPDKGWMVLLMTPHSVGPREGHNEGVCINELAFARDREFGIVPVMVFTVELPLLINTRQYLDMTDCVPVSERTASYQRKFERLCRALETHGLLVEGESNRLRRALRPVSTGVNATFYLPRFVERRSLIRAFEEWTADLSGAPVFWVTGSLGTGKSTLAAWLCSRHGEVKAFHVCGYLNPSKTNAREALRSIAWQLANELPAYAGRLNAIGELESLCRDPDVDLFDRLIVQPMHGLPAPDKPVVVLIDALDEAAAADVNVLADLLGREVPRLPAWLRVAITSAPDPKVTVPLQAWRPVEIVPDAPENVEEFLEYVEKHIGTLVPGGRLEPAVLQRLLDASEYNWLYIDWVRRALEQGNLTLDTLDQFPQGLGGACHHEFARRFPERDPYARLPRPVLTVLAAAAEPLAAADYARVLGRPEAEVNDVVRDLGGLVVVREGRVRPFHHALVDWLTASAKSGEHAVSVLDGHRWLADDGWAQFARDPLRMAPYALAHLPRHLREVQDAERLDRVVTDARVIARRVEADDLDELARYWKDVPAPRLRQLCADSHAALPTSGVDDAVRRVAAVGTGQLFQQAGLYDDAIGYFERALRASRRERDACAAGQAELNIGWCLRHAEAFERAVGHASAAIELFRAGGSREGRARALSVRGMCHWHLREDLAALRDLRDAASAYEECGDDRSRSEALNHLGIVQRSLGLYDEALASLHQSETLSTRFKDARGLGKCLNSLGTAYWWKGDRERAMELYRRADAVNGEVNQPYVRGLTANNLGYVYLEMQLPRQAFEAFRRARSIRRELRIEGYEMMDVSGMALASHALQHDEEARALSGEAVRRLRRFKALEDLERAYYNHYVIMAGGSPADRREGVRALRRARALVMTRMGRIGDDTILARYREVPLVKTILEAADSALGRAKRPTEGGTRSPDGAGVPVSTAREGSPGSLSARSAGRRSGRGSPRLRPPSAGRARSVREPRRAARPSASPPTSRRGMGR